MTELCNVASHADLLARVEAAEQALLECIPYVNRALNPNDPDNAPWRIEIATGVMERLRAALALREEPGEPDPATVTVTQGGIGDTHGFFLPPAREETTP